jgi:hypothetical protein
MTGHPGIYGRKRRQRSPQQVLKRCQSMLAAKLGNFPPVVVGATLGRLFR